MGESLRLVKRFAAACLMTLCVIGMGCGAALADSNTRRLALDEPGRQVGFSFDRETVTIMSGEQAFALPALAPVLRWARLAPAPLGTLVMVIASLTPTPPAHPR